MTEVPTRHRLRVKQRAQVVTYAQEHGIKPAATLGLVRHPMYSGGLALGLGWTLYVQSWLTLGYVIALFVVPDVKSRREDGWLAERFPTYTTYQQRVRKLIPLVY